MGSAKLSTENTPPRSISPIVLAAQHLTKYYPVHSGLFKRLFTNRSPNNSIKALNNVSFSLARGKTLAVVGESGCGKSTLARQLTMIETPTSGSLIINGCDVANADRMTRKALRRQVQIVFQNLFASLNPRKTVKATLAEPLIVNTILSAAARNDRIIKILHTVGLPPEYAQRYPHMLSGGQRQRIAIARAMILRPQILVADEPVSALDVSIQAQILNLFMDLQDRFDTSYVFISHNLSVVEHIADDLMVMYLGGIAEIGDKATIFARPRHPYTCALISAMPKMNVLNGVDKYRQVKIPIQGEPPSPLNPPTGCTFHLRCPYVIDRCRGEEPKLRAVDNRWVSCHRAEIVSLSSKLVNTNVDASDQLTDFRMLADNNLKQ